jgi:hypothetical protein
MPRETQLSASLAERLASRISEALVRERVIPRFVDSYVVEHGRHALQVHAPLYRDLLALLQREALLAACVCLLETACLESVPASRARQQTLPRRGAAAFRKRFLAALTREQRWTAGDALDFQSDLQMYEELLARSGSARRARKPFETANHPFVDRCAFVLDSSFLEQARLAASRALAAVEELAAAVAQQEMHKSRSV